MVVTGTHDPYLVALSILVACFASYTALDLSAHVVAARGFARRVWLVAAALTMGGGIWSMHFVAMLAFSMPTLMSYDIGLTTLSLMVAIFVTGGGFYVISRQSASPLRSFCPETRPRGNQCGVLCELRKKSKCHDILHPTGVRCDRRKNGQDLATTP
jgi:NO-binding membrane sensor protein with MHYT domain